MPPPKQVSAEERQKRIVEVAEKLLRESGGVAFSMRALAAHANISLKTAYNLFGSKQGVMLQIFRAEQLRFLDELREVSAEDKLDEVFLRLELAAKHFLQNEEFYRYIFNVADAVNVGTRQDPAREVFETSRRYLVDAMASGVVLTDFDLDMAAEHFTDLFSSAVKEWAKGAVPSERLYQRMAYGQAVALAAVCAPEGAARMRRLAVALQSDPTATTHPRASERVGGARRAAAGGGPG
jgi:AcrR family transcriptional regulator